MNHIDVNARNKDGSLKRPQLHGPSRAAKQACRAAGVPFGGDILPHTETGSTNKWRSTRSLLRRMGLLNGVKPSMLSTVTQAARKERERALGLNPLVFPTKKTASGFFNKYLGDIKLQRAKETSRQRSIPKRSLRDKVGGFFKRMLPTAFKGSFAIALFVSFGCSGVNDGSGCDVGKMRCNGNTAELCQYAGGSGLTMWGTWRDCSVDHLICGSGTAYCSGYDIACCYSY